MNELQLLKAHYDSKQTAERPILLIDTDKRIILTHSVQAGMKEASADGSLIHLISTPRIDYVMDVMNPYGCDDTPLRKNRGVFYNHKWNGVKDLPVGKNVWLKSTPDGVLVKTQFAINEYSFAADVFNLLKGDFLNSFSIGFMLGEYEFVPIKDLSGVINGKYNVPNLSEFSGDDKVILHKSWTVYEYSPVGVPMNMDAVKKALEQGAIKSDFGKDFFGSLAGRGKAIEIVGEVNADEKNTHDTSHCKGCAGGECKGAHCSSCSDKGASCGGSHCDTCNEKAAHDGQHCKGCQKKAADIPNEIKTSDEIKKLIEEQAEQIKQICSNIRDLNAEIQKTNGQLIPEERIKGIEMQLEQAMVVFENEEIQNNNNNSAKGTTTETLESIDISDRIKKTIAQRS